MQKVVGSNPISRSSEVPAVGGDFAFQGGGASFGSVNRSGGSGSARFPVVTAFLARGNTWSSGPMSCADPTRRTIFGLPLRVFTDALVAGRGYGRPRLVR
jgi:hypothetical protein